MRRSIVCVLLLGVVMAAYGNDRRESARQQGPSESVGIVEPRASESAGKVEQKPVEGVGIVAHRGYWNCEAGGFARNSIAALKAAQDAGFWGSEFDVNMTADSVLIVFHDSSIGGKKIEKNLFSDFAEHRLENGEQIPTLDAFLTQGQKSERTKLVFELKAHSSPEVEDRAIRLSLKLLADKGLLKPERVMFISFSLHACREFARLCPGFQVQYLGANLWPSELKENGLNGIDMNQFYYLPVPRFHDEARELGMSINVWTVNKEKDMERVVATGIDLLTTDEPMKAREMLQEREERR